MPCDRPLRNAHSSLPYPSVATRSTCQPNLSSSSFRHSPNISSVSHIPPGQYGPAEAVCIPGEISVDLDTIVPVSWQQPFTFDNAFNLNPQPTISDLSYQSSAPELLLPFPLSTCPPPPCRLLEDVASIDIDLLPIESPDTLAEAKAVPVSLNQRASSLFVNQGYQPQHFNEEHHPIHYNLTDPHTMWQPSMLSSFPNLSLQSYPALLSESFNQFSLVDPRHHPSYHGYPPALLLSQTEQAQPTQTYWMSERYEQRNPNGHVLGLQHRNQGILPHAHDFSINDSVFVDKSLVVNKTSIVSNSSDNFMASFLKETIIGAEFDSSDRGILPRCHPGTRARIIERCQTFVLTCNGCQKLQWVVGAAGVGKSAIMQSIAEDKSKALSNVIVGTTIFFSINGRQDGTKAITTIAYQLAVKLEPYRLFVQNKITHDPSLLRKSLRRQFNKFIVEPFVNHCLLDLSSRLLIVIDGIDECNDPLMQQELLGLISFFCITYPTSPLVWMVASCPEPHITSFFSWPKVTATFVKEEILVDSNDACEDVKRYLRDKFREIRMTSIALQGLAQWPSPTDFSKIAEASGGLFAYTSTVIRYIGDPTCGDPISQLENVLKVIDSSTEDNLPGKDHPMAQLDALYAHIMSKIPAHVMDHTRKLLLMALVFDTWCDDSFLFICNMLGMTQSTAYGATHHIRSVVDIPGPTEAAECGFKIFHKLFADYLNDFRWSGFFQEVKSTGEELGWLCVMRVLEQALDGFYLDNAGSAGMEFCDGLVKNGPGTCDNISLSWPAVGKHDDRQLRLDMCHISLRDVNYRFEEVKEVFQKMFCTCVLTTSYIELPDFFPWHALGEFAFDESRSRELLEHGILKQVPLELIDDGSPLGLYDRQGRSLGILLCSKGPNVPFSDHWNTSCQHARENKLEGQGHNYDWSTYFCPPERPDDKDGCSYCLGRFTHHFRSQLPGHLVTVLDFTSTMRLVELRFVDLDDGVSEWIYRFPHGKQWKKFDSSG